METVNIAREIALLPPDAQQQVVDFVAFLKVRYLMTRPTHDIKPIALTDEPFIGMWRDRQDMQDSSAWVRNLRQGEWESSQ